MTRIDSRTYTKEVRGLRRLASQLGYTVSLSYVAKRQVKTGPRLGAIEGYFDQKEKRLVIKAYKRLRRSRVLFVLAHELRHAQHAVYGMYPDYYGKNFYAWCDWANGRRRLPPLTLPPSRRIAHLAEKDCDDFSSGYLAGLGIIDALPSDYPYHQTATYKLWRMIRARLTFQLKTLRRRALKALKIIVHRPALRSNPG